MDQLDILPSKYSDDIRERGGALFVYARALPKEYVFEIIETTEYLLFAETTGQLRPGLPHMREACGLRSRLPDDVNMARQVLRVAQVMLLYIHKGQVDLRGAQYTEIVWVAGAQIAQDTALCPAPFAPPKLVVNN